MGMIQTIYEIEENYGKLEEIIAQKSFFPSQTNKYTYHPPTALYDCQSPVFSPRFRIPWQCNHISEGMNVSLDVV